MADQDPPRQPAEWRKQLVGQKVEGKTIHDMEFNSASKFQKHEYMMLRVLWRGKDRRSFRPDKFGLAEWVKQASHQLEQYKSWKAYCASFTGGDSEGTFALARFYQKQVMWVPEDIPFNTDVTTSPSPISTRTRSRQKGLEAQLRQLHLQTPSKAPKNQPKTPRTPPTDIYNDNSDTEEADDTPEAPYSTGPPELLDIAFPKTKDEQIVNAALLDFLNAFIIHRDVHHKSRVQWTLYRKPFNAEFSKGSVHARTDGCLENVSSERVYALVEVKPVVRSKARFAIAMQEAAQMVAWIKTNPDPANSVGTRGCRLHVSQDRNEIYIIFAEYGEEYVKYLNNELGPTDDPGFLTMHEFGPWDTEKQSHMEAVGEILLAIALRAEGA